MDSSGFCHPDTHDQLHATPAHYICNPQPDADCNDDCYDDQYLYYHSDTNHQHHTNTHQYALLTTYLYQYTILTAYLYQHTHPFCYSYTSTNVHGHSDFHGYSNCHHQSQHHAHAP